MVIALGESESTTIAKRISSAKMNLNVFVRVENADVPTQEKTRLGVKWGLQRDEVQTFNLANSLALLVF